MADGDLRYRTLFETTPDLVIVMDETGRVVSANPSVERVLGYKPSDLAGAPLSRIMPERLRKRHEEGFHRYLTSGKRALDWRSIELPGLSADGREIDFTMSFGEFEQDGTRFFTGIMRDVTAERKRQYMLEFLARVGPELASSSLDYKATLRTVAQLAVPSLADWCAVDIAEPGEHLERVAVAHKDPAKVALAHQITSRYPADHTAPHGAGQVARTGRTELVAEIGSEILEAVAQSPEHLDLLRSLGLRSYITVPLAAHGHMYGALTFVQAESGKTFSDDDVPFMEELGRRAAIAIHNARLHRDALASNHVLEEQAIELEQQQEEAQALTEELEAQTDELRNLAENLSQKSEEANAANKAKSEFLASMSHELRTPLNAIAGYVDLLQLELRGPITDEQRADLERIRVSQNHLLTLIDDVLRFAKIDAGRLEYRMETVLLDQTLKICEAMILPQIHAKRISYSYEECGLPVLVVADQEKVQQIVLNLLGNAVKFTPEGGTLIASCDQTESEGRVHVEDTGIGIAPDHLKSIFEPFVQVDRALNHPAQGAGLGLAISRTLARAMGGDIVVSSEPGKGSKFTLTLPRAPENSNGAKG